MAAVDGQENLVFRDANRRSFAAGQHGGQHLRGGRSRRQIVLLAAVILAVQRNLCHRGGIAVGGHVLSQATSHRLSIGQVSRFHLEDGEPQQR